MKIVVLDGYTLNPGDLDWQGVEKFGELSVYDRTPYDKVVERMGDAEIVFTNRMSSACTARCWTAPKGLSTDKPLLK